MINIEFEKDQKRSAAYEDGKEIGFSYFQISPTVWNIYHTEVEEGHEGEGIAKKLVEKIVDSAREEGIKIMATCPYARRLFKNSNEYDDVVIK